VFLTSGTNSYLNVLTQSGEEFHEASNGKVTCAVPHQQGDLRLLHAEVFGYLDLSHTAVFKDCADLQGKLCLEKFLFSIGKSEVCKDVSASLGYASNTVAPFLCFGSHLNSAFLYNPNPPDGFQRLLHAYTIILIMVYLSRIPTVPKKATAALTPAASTRRGRLDESA